MHRRARRYHLARRLVIAVTLPTILLMAAVHAAGPESAKPIYLDQGWNDDTRSAFYFKPQGSRLMPYTWFLALEEANGAARFASLGNLTRFGWLYFDRAESNPDGLPIGFARDPVDVPETGPWVGLTCAACHTGEITHAGRRIRIDGGAAHLDLGDFLGELSNAVKATRASDGKFSRFAANVYGRTPSAEETRQLKSVFQEFSIGFEGRAGMRMPPRPAGPGRVDALGQIMNALSVFNLREPDNQRASDAPTSYPFLWLTPKLDWVQWAPIATNPIARNVGEVLGVFGEASFTNDKDLFQSSALLRSLSELETAIDTLNPPRWPASFGAIDARKAARGKTLFARDCRACHNMPPFDMTAAEQNVAGRQFIKTRGIPVDEIGTDATYTWNLTTRQAKTGALSAVLFNKQPVVTGLEFFLTTVGATLKTAFAVQHVSVEDQLKYSGYRYFPASPGEAPAPWTAPLEATKQIKAGPLLGIWATGPFLHNGSVPSVYELLLPPNQRSTVFLVGSREINADKLGYRSTKLELSKAQQRTLFLFDTRLPGNANSGHVYPAKPYSEADRMAVIEYLKDPESFATR